MTLSKKAIIDERGWEFGGENIRKFDLIRWNYYSDAIVNTIEWMRDVAMNYNQLENINGEFIYNSEKEIEDMNVAPRLYYEYINGRVIFENDYFTYRDQSNSTYSSATTLSDNDIKTPNATFEGLKRIGFADSFISVSSTNPETGEAYGKDENGNDIKKGTLHERVMYSWHGLTDGALIKGTEDISSLRNKVTPYVFPIPTDRVVSSNGVLSNDGYAIRNK